MWIIQSQENPFAIVVVQISKIYYVRECCMQKLHKKVEISGKLLVQKIKSLKICKIGLCRHVSMQKYAPIISLESLAYTIVSYFEAMILCKQL